MAEELSSGSGGGIKCVSGVLEMSLFQTRCGNLYTPLA